MQRVLGTECGGIVEVLSNLYAVTGKDYGLEVAQRFDKKQFFDPLAAHRDELKGLHVNTHIPQLIAAARYYKLTGDHRYRDIAEYFWDEVVSERSYCTGGTSNGESWNTDPGKLSTELGPSTTECCCGLQHDEADAASVGLVSRRSLDGLLRAHAFESSSRNNQSPRRHHDVLPPARVRILENLRLSVVLHPYGIRGIREADRLDLLS
jgi:Beta-L-arabinofuranosidase, GH127 catalytic domain